MENETPTTSRAARVLVIERHAVLRTRVREVVAAELPEARIDVAASAEEGWELFRAGAYDLVLVDVWSPGEDGFTLLRAIHEADPTVGVIVLSWLDEAPYAAAAARWGAAGYVRKTAMPAELGTVLRRALEARRNGEATGKRR